MDTMTVEATEITTTWRLKEYTSPKDFGNTACDLLTLPISSKLFYVGFAQSPPMVEAAQRLRYQVFNEEMGHGIDSNVATGIDVDEFDEQMTHIIILCKKTQKVVGTYRIQTDDTVRKYGRFYSANEYDLTALETLKQDGLLELGRACVDMEYRTSYALMALWKAIVFYARTFNKRWMFGCCSISTQDPVEAWHSYYYLKQNNLIDPNLLVAPVGDYICPEPEGLDPRSENTKIPKLFRVYLRLGAQVISYPAIDREFGTIDFLAMLDIKLTDTFVIPTDA